MTGLSFSSEAVELCNWFDLIGDELSETQGKQMRDLEFLDGVFHCKQQTIAITGTTMFTINHTEQAAEVCRNKQLNS